MSETGREVPLDRFRLMRPEATLIVCHTCDTAFVGDFRTAQDHALDEHRDIAPSGVWFTDVFARPEALSPPARAAERGPEASPASEQTSDES